LTVFACFFERECRAGFAAARRIAYHPGKIADDENGLMAQILKLAQLAENDGVTEMEVWPAGITTELDGERLVGLDGPFQFPDEIVFRDDF
jgi:hypothetical protein